MNFDYDDIETKVKNNNKEVEKIKEDLLKEEKLEIDLDDRLDELEHLKKEIINLDKLLETSLTKENVEKLNKLMNSYEVLKHSVIKELEKLKKYENVGKEIEANKSEILEVKSETIEEIKRRLKEANNTIKSDLNNALNDVNNIKNDFENTKVKFIKEVDKVDEKMSNLIGVFNKYKKTFLIYGSVLAFGIISTLAATSIYTKNYMNETIDKSKAIVNNVETQTKQLEQTFKKVDYTNYVSKDVVEQLKQEQLSRENQLVKEFGLAIKQTQQQSDDNFEKLRLAYLKQLENQPKNTSSSDLKIEEKVERKVERKVEEKVAPTFSGTKSGGIVKNVFFCNEETSRIEINKDECNYISWLNNKKYFNVGNEIYQVLNDKKYVIVGRF